AAALRASAPADGRGRFSRSSGAASEANVKYPDGETYAFGFRAVQDKAPSAAGVYGIFTSRRWLYVGESDDIRESLFQSLNDPDASWSAEHRPLSFSFETAEPVAT